MHEGRLKICLLYWQPSGILDNFKLPQCVALEPFLKETLLTQLIEESNHQGDNILDLLVSNQRSAISTIKIINVNYSDNKMIKFNLSQKIGLIRHQKQVFIKSWNNTEEVKYQNKLDLMLTLNQNLNCPDEDCHILIDAFLIAARETMAITRRNSKIRNCPAWDKELNELKRNHCTMEKKQEATNVSELRKLPKVNSEKQNGFPTKENSVLLKKINESLDL